MIIQELIDKYFTPAYSELGEQNYLISKNSKFILDFNNDKTFSLKPNSENINNSKIRKYYELDRNEFGGNFNKLTENNFKKLIEEIYS